MKLRITFLLALGVAGIGGSIALADGGHGRNDTSTNACKHAQVSGTVSAPQTFTVTVTKGNKHSGLAAGQVVTVSLGTTGQTVRFHGEGCVGTDGTFTVDGAELHGQHAHPGKHGDGGTTTSTTVSTNSTTTE